MRSLLPRLARPSERKIGRGAPISGTMARANQSRAFTVARNLVGEMVSLSAGPESLLGPLHLHFEREARVIVYLRYLKV